MLRQLLIVNGRAGIALFEKEWVKLMDKSTRMFGSLLATLHQYSRQSVGLPVSYIEFGSVGLSIIQHEKTSLLCTLFHDIEDGQAFGRHVASEILQSFIEEYGEQVDFGTAQPARFRGFSSRLVDSISGSVQSILRELQSTKGVEDALFVYDDGQKTYSGGQMDDQLSIIANLQAITTFSSSIMQQKQDVPTSISMDMTRQVVFISRIGDASLVCVCRKAVNRSVYEPSLNQSVIMLSKVRELVSNLG
eukprot:TRINITY_DN1397_c0_g1_i1.p1 TRINITY_DN1397_c0_g1~~TRINITY_DN1397_c0_g1_i1.p1  ORF type:complete len:248 (+),score=59.24 TRINITY_DN1397_c0_g1_i1:523-1266(+)